MRDVVVWLECIVPVSPLLLALLPALWSQPACVEQRLKPMDGSGWPEDNKFHLMQSSREKREMVGKCQAN